MAEGRWDPSTMAPGQEGPPRRGGNALYAAVAVGGLVILVGLAFAAAAPMLSAPKATAQKAADTSIDASRSAVPANATTAPAAAPPALAEPPAPTEVEKRREVEATLDSWRDAWQAMDLSGYMEFYAPEFRSSKPKRRSLDAWRAWKRDVFSTYGYQQVSMKSRRVTVKGDRARVTFLQVFRSDSKTSSAGYQDTGLKEMELMRQSDGSWLITREDWTKAGS